MHVTPHDRSRCVPAHTGLVATQHDFVDVIVVECPIVDCDGVLANLASRSGTSSAFARAKPGMVLNLEHVPARAPWVALATIVALHFRGVGLGQTDRKMH